MTTCNCTSLLRRNVDFQAYVRLQKRSHPLYQRMGSFDLLFFPIDPCVNRGQEEQREQRRDEQAAGESEGHRSPEVGTHQRDHAQNRGERGKHDRPETHHGGVDDGLVERFPIRAVRFDLIEQNDRVTNDHARQRNDPENGDETERFTRQLQGDDGADQTERRGDGRHEHEPNFAELEHEDHENHEDHDRHDDDNGVYGRVTAFDTAVIFERISGRQIFAEMRKRFRVDPLRNGIGRRIIGDIGANGNGRC